MSAASVNQMRLLSSVALAKTEKLMFAASCSAADAIYVILKPRGPARRLQHRGRLIPTPCRRSGGQGAPRPRLRRGTAPAKAPVSPQPLFFRLRLLGCPRGFGGFRRLGGGFGRRIGSGLGLLRLGGLGLGGERL